MFGLIRGSDSLASRGNFLSRTTASRKRRTRKKTEINTVDIDNQRYSAGEANFPWKSAITSVNRGFIKTRIAGKAGLLRRG
jgi:flagellar basal body rod protein FlgB